MLGSSYGSYRICPHNFSFFLRYFHFHITIYSVHVLFSCQAIDDDCNQTGQMTAALLDWPQVSVVQLAVLAFISNIHEVN